MNVLMMVSWYTGKGDELSGGKGHNELARTLQKYCNVAIYYPYDRNIKTCYDDEFVWGVRTFRTKYRLKNKLRNRIYMIYAMRKIVKSFKPDIIHSNVATETGRFAIVLGKLFHIPVIITEHSAIENSLVETFPHHQYADFAYKYSKFNACVSDDLTKKLSQIYPKYSFNTIYNGIVLPDNIKTEKKYRKENCVNIIFVAAMYDRYIKGVDYILESVKNLRNEGYSIVLHLVGDGEYKTTFENLANNIGIIDNCIFYGLCSRTVIFSMLSEMDFMVSASLSESFGCAIAESVMMGVPVLATKCGGPESIIEKDNGILVEPKNQEKLDEGMKYMCEHYKDYDRKRISDKAREKFSIEKIAQDYIKIYENVLKEK